VAKGIPPLIRLPNRRFQAQPLQYLSELVSVGAIFLMPDIHQYQFRDGVLILGA
jgi:hypothetical protein